ncbi:MAG: hypothetical protein HQK53_02165 [Oligoflexia bacterium]|nr:hypothetical protein [Oligoflexia bacterium]
MRAKDTNRLTQMYSSGSVGSIKREHDGKILLVSSNEHSREGIASILRFYRFEVIQTGNGFQSLNLLENSLEADVRISLVLVGPDTLLMSPEEVIALIRTKYKKEELPVLRLFNPDDFNDEDADRALSVGANTIVTALLPPGKIVERIQELIK